MPKVHAFVGRSFNKDDANLINIFLRHFDTYKKLGFFWEDAEEAESRSVAEKVKTKLADKHAFIGIFTKKLPLSNKFARQLNPNDLTRYTRFLWRKNSLSAASGWTMQESGYAIGKSMKLIMLVEEGVIDIGGLQGDHEIIQFSRKDPEKCFPLLHTQIVNLLAEPEPLKEKTDAESVPQKPEGSKKDPQEGKKEEETERDYFFELIVKIRHEKDEDGAKQLFDEWLRSADTDYERIRRKAVYESLRLGAGFAGAFQQLERLIVEFPDHPTPLATFGRRLKDLGQLSTAAARLRQASEKEKDLPAKARLIVEAAVCLTLDNKQADGIALLSKSLFEYKGSPEVAFEIYKGLSEIAEIIKDDDQRVALLEKALSLRPAAYNLRFQVAFTYSKMGKHALALYHYKILTGSASNGSNLNNLGVVYSNLNLPCKSAAAYKRAATEFNETLAMANLAYNFIGAGFLDEAKGLIDKALSIKEFHENVASARARIDAVKKEEEDKEEKILKGMEGERKFRLDFADAAYPVADKIPPFAGKWKTPHGEIDIESKDGIITGQGISHEAESGLSLGLLWAGQTTETQLQITKTIYLKATLQGASARGLMSVETARGTLLSSSKNEIKIQLLCSASEIRAMEVNEKGNISLARYTRITEA